MTDRSNEPGPTAHDADGWIQKGFWAPSREWATAKFLVPLRKSLQAKKAAGQVGELSPAVQAFQDWISADGYYYDLVNAMIDESNDFVAANAEDIQEIESDGDTIWIPNYEDLFILLDQIVTTSPSFNTTVMVGTPMNGLLAVAMATPSGLKLFIDPTFNAQLKKVLDAWNTFLKSPDSLDKLDISNPEKPGSWISQQAYTAGVWTQMQYDETKPGYGFSSWNDFFIRQFVPGARPFQGDPTEVVNIGCETTPWEYADDLPLSANFAIKEVNYSLVDIFGGDEDLAQRFVGGQLYQGFLSATHYHRWNAPLTGRIVRSWVEPGTYFAQNPSQGEGEGTWDGTQSQPYLPQVAARAIFIFENESFGQVAMVLVGMVEVSTCVIKEGYQVDAGAAPVEVTRGDEIGHFEFGGSTHVVIFQKGRAELVDWAVRAIEHRNDANPQPLGSIIANLP